MAVRVLTLRSQAQEALLSDKYSGAQAPCLPLLRELAGSLSELLSAPKAPPGTEPHSSESSPLPAATEHGMHLELF